MGNEAAKAGYTWKEIEKLARRNAFINWIQSKLSFFP